MEVDAIKGKGKDGQQGKKGKKGKGEKAKGKGKKDPGHETRVCRYCDKPGHLIADCRKRIADEKREKKVASVQPDGGQQAQPSTASIASQDTVYVPPGPLASSASSSSKGVRAVLPSDLAAGAALLAQQALSARHQESRASLSLCALLPEEPWPDTDDEITICMVGPQCPREREDEDIWALWDSGSGLTTCPEGYFPEGNIHSAKALPKLVTATGGAVKVNQACTVDLTAETGDTLNIQFRESNVDKFRPPRVYLLVPTRW